MIKLFIMFLAFFGMVCFANQFQSAQHIAFNCFGFNFTWALCAGLGAVVLASRLKSK